ncbi:hypothetical protein Q3G72_004036 [Acer saccharum]|nr:hypothetical protein Q3G72_004036 [Acer saccharum]
MVATTGVGGWRRSLHVHHRCRRRLTPRSRRLAGVNRTRTGVASLIGLYCRLLSRSHRARTLVARTDPPLPRLPRSRRLAGVNRTITGGGDSAMRWKRQPGQD